MRWKCVKTQENLFRKDLSSLCTFAVLRSIFKVYGVSKCLAGYATAVLTDKVEAVLCRLLFRNKLPTDVCKV